MLNDRRFRGPSPKKELGQHFLLDEEIARRIVAALELNWEERVLEIGPGRGVLLRFLLKGCRTVTAVELDLRLKPNLLKVFGGHPGLELVFEDFMRFDLSGYLQLGSGPVKVVGNIPYSLTSSILFRLLEPPLSHTGPTASPLICAVLMLQKEVAERLCAEPGQRACGGITIFRSLIADARLLFPVPPEAFLPPPKVTSAVVRLDFLTPPRYNLVADPTFKELVHHLFTQRRKMIKNTLGSLHWVNPQWQEMDFNYHKRPEELTLSEWNELYHLVR